MITISESGVVFGPFDEKLVFKIEDSSILATAGEGIKTVEFIYLYKDHDYLLVEAKTSCPNKDNAKDDAEKTAKYKAYFDDVAQKFEDSLDVFSACMMGQHGDSPEIGSSIKEKKPFTLSKLFLVLVITSAQESWLPGPKAELENHLRSLLKKYKAEVIVLNTELAMQKGLIQ